MPQGTSVRRGEGDLLAQRGVAGLAQHAAVRLVEHQAWASGTRTSSPTTSAARRRAPTAIERPAERGPVAHRHVALGDGQQAGQARLRGQQVVEAGVELLLGDAVADVEQVPPAVVQEAEVGAPGELLAAWRRCACRRAAVASSSGSPSRASSRQAWRHREQVAAEVAAVHGGHVHRQQRRARSGCRTSSGSGRGGAAAWPAWPAWPPGASAARPCRSSRTARAQATLSRYRPMLVGEVRCATMSCGSGLQVVGRQVVVFGADAALEEAPGVARDAFQVGRGRRRAASRRGARPARPADPPGPQRRRPPTAGTARWPAAGAACRRRAAPRSSSSASTGSAQCRRSSAARSRARPRPAPRRRWSTAAGGGG